MSIYRGVPPKNHNLISDKLQKWGDSHHKMDPSDYKEGLLVLSSHDYDQLYEAVLVSENFLSYNGSWDFRREMKDVSGIYTCDLYFKWNGYFGMCEISKKIKLPSGVNKRFVFFKDRNTSAKSVNKQNNARW